MKKHLFFTAGGGMLVGLLLILTWSGAESISPVEKEAWLQHYQYETNTFPIIEGIWGYILENLRLPSSIQEICDSPHIPVRCRDLINPYTGKPIEEKKDSPGDIWLELTPTFTLVYVSKDKTGNIAVHRGSGEFWSLHLNQSQKNYENFGEHYITHKLRQMTPPEKTAYMVFHYIMDAIENYASLEELVGIEKEAGPHLHYLPTTLQQIFEKERELLEKYPWSNLPPSRLMDKLRNEFTGGYAVEVSSPSPGNYQYYFEDAQPIITKHYEIRYPSSRLACLEVYGEGGRVLEKRCYPTVIQSIPNSTGGFGGPNPPPK